jgi:hypothetical protein
VLPGQLSAPILSGWTAGTSTTLPAASLRSRLIKRLRIHGIIKNVAYTHKYDLSSFGKRVVAAGLHLKTLKDWDAPQYALVDRLVHCDEDISYPRGYRFKQSFGPSIEQKRTNGLVFQVIGKQSSPAQIDQLVR